MQWHMTHYTMADGNRLQKLNIKQQRINRAISGGAIVKTGCLLNETVDMWRARVKKREEASGRGLLTVCRAD